MLMRERPIPFNGEMVRAVLGGRKTQTRRLIKKNPPEIKWTGERWVAVGHDSTLRYEIKCPYGQPGDQLWVRESYLPDPPNDGSWDYYGFTDGAMMNIKALPDEYRNPDNCVYAATWDGPGLKWRRSIHMPRWASRIQLVVTGVRVERVQDVTLGDLRAEGIRHTLDYAPILYDCFADLWDQIYATRGYSWASNPWVWAITFEVLAP